MKFDPVKVVHVYYKPMDDKIFVGRLALNKGKLFFSLKSGVIAGNDFTFDGLSLPEPWQPVCS